MESGNSGSFQSSTGDEEFDSLGDRISALTNNLGPAPTSFANQPAQPQPPPPQPQRNTISSYMYDQHHQPQQPPPPPQPLQQQLENYQSSFLNSYVLDWSNNNTQRTDTNPTDFNPMLASILASSSTSHHHHRSTPPPQPSLHHHHPPPPTVVPENPRVSLLEPPPPSKKPRKRSRASRGAATTVLTTDTTNFRAMVQEFTGIPDPPFTSTPPHFQRTRLENIFGTSSGITTTPPYLRRPFPQKINLPFSTFLGSSNTNNINNYQFTPQLESSSLFNLQTHQVLPPSLSLQKSHHDLSNDQINTNMLTRPSTTTGYLDLISSSTINNNNQDGGSLRWGINNVNGTVGSNQQEDEDQNHVTIATSTTNNSNFSFSSS